MPDQILAQTRQQLLGGEEAAMQQHVWLAILRHALAGSWLVGQDIALDDRGMGIAGGRGGRSKQSARLPPITMTSRMTTSQWRSAPAPLCTPSRPFALSRA